MRVKTYSIEQFKEQFPTDEACLEKIFQSRYGDCTTCPSCQRETKFFKVNQRKCYACKYCGYQLHPLANTIFHKSDTPLRLWFYAIFLYTSSEGNISAKELQRRLGVTYKCAWRMTQKIRSLFIEDTSNEHTSLQDTLI